MSQVTLETLAERVEKLEQAMNRLLQKEGNRDQGANEQPRKEPEPIVFKDWRKAVEFTATLPPLDPELQRQYEAILREMREADRRASIEEAEGEEAERGGGA